MYTWRWSRQSNLTRPQFTPTNRRRDMAPLRIRPVVNDRFIGFVGQTEGYEKDQRRRARLTRITASREDVALPNLPSRSHPLYDSILKLRVANDQLGDLRRDIDGLINSKRNSIRFEDEPGGTHKLIRLVVGQPPNPKRDVKVGGLAVLLRSVLDVTLTQLSKGRAGRPRKPQFPIFVYRTHKRGNVPTFLRARGGVRHINHLRTEERAIIERVQPYHAGNLRWHHPLWILQGLSNTDKHNSLTEASVSIGSSAYWFAALPSCCTRGMELRAGIPFEDGAILGRVGREVNVKPRYSIALRFVEGCPGAGDEVIHTLTRIEEQVRKIVVEFLSL